MRRAYAAGFRHTSSCVSRRKPSAQRWMSRRSAGTSAWSRWTWATNRRPPP